VSLYIKIDGTAVMGVTVSIYSMENINTKRANRKEILKNKGKMDKMEC
jgi:hypothetical protein